MNFKQLSILTILKLVVANSYLQSQGTKLIFDGSPFYIRGANYYALLCIEGKGGNSKNVNCHNYWGETRVTSSNFRRFVVDFAVKCKSLGINTVRIWTFPSYFTLDSKSNVDFTNFDILYNAFKEQSIFLVPTLSDNWGHTVSRNFWNGGYDKDPSPGLGIPFSNFAIQFASHVRDYSYIGWIQIMNEASIYTVMRNGEKHSETTSRIVDVLSKLYKSIKKADSNHLIASSGNLMDNTENDSIFISIASIGDLICIHDYYSGGKGLDPHLKRVIKGTSVPIVIEEFNYPKNSDPSTMISSLKEKINYYKTQPEVTGYLIWQIVHQSQSSITSHINSLNLNQLVGSDKSIWSSLGY